ncbi:hypothetical protein N9315_02310 [Alphaproteobacteria bacterium]|nr:hypothetical protein [Alphaproteobacteria bacterium]
MFGKNWVSPVAPRNPSQIDEDVRIRGTITLSEPLVMAGHLDGDINADTLHIEQQRILKGCCTVRMLPLMMAQMLTQNSPRSR